ncbi:MAG: hypothetical protein ACFFCI_08810 [Promethearchaeota archaeon]
MSQFLDPLYDIFNGFNYFMYVLLKNANYLFFFIFLILGVVLILNAREIEYDEKIHGKIELVKTRGRIGSAIYSTLAFGFISKEFTNFLFTLFFYLPEPALLEKFLYEVDSISLASVHTLSLGQRTVFFFISLLSLTSLILIIIGVYLMLFNKFILRSKLKTLTFLGLGLILWILVGFRIALRLII